MKTQLEKLNRLLSERSGLELADVKFFRGRNRTTTQEELLEEAANAASQVVLGFVKPSTSVDSGIEKTELARFLQR